jgi:hypothetical protein
MVKRVRATNKQKRYTRSAAAKDFAKMAAAASVVVIENRGNQYRTGNPEYVLFSFPFWVKFGNDFPKGHIVSKTLTMNTYKINAVKLLNWLHTNGHSSYDSKMLVQQTRQFELLNASLDRLFTFEGE